MSTSRFVLFVQLQGFYIQTQAPASLNPTVIHREKRVLDANEIAQEKGITLGMGLAEAKALLGKEGTFVQWDEEAYRTTQTKWLDVCTEHADIIEPTDQHEAYLDLSDHPDPEDVQARLVSDLQAKAGLKVRTGLAGCRWIARIVAIRGRAQIAIKDPQEYVAPLPVSVLPLSEGYTVRLGLLGCRNVSDVAKMSTDALRRQFGKEAYSIQRIARGSGEARVQRVYPPNCIGGRFTFEGQAEDLEVFDNALKHLAKTIGKELADREEFGEVLEVWLEDEDGKIERQSRKYSKPIASPASLLVALRLLCGTIEKPVVRIRLQVPNLRKAVRVQRTLANMTAPGAKHEASKTALAHVKAAFGDGAIQLGSEISVPRWRKVRQVWSVANGWTWR